MADKNEKEILKSAKLIDRLYNYTVNHGKRLPDIEQRYHDGQGSDFFSSYTQIKPYELERDNIKVRAEQTYHESTSGTWECSGSDSRTESISIYVGDKEILSAYKTGGREGWHLGLTGNSRWKDKPNDWSFGKIIKEDYNSIRGSLEEMIKREKS